ncbi:MAG: hypothetical protein KF830_17420 [Planctomycetes bacterium]|nr:hypothetical protein [Planctomycetota bacterium]
MTPTTPWYSGDDEGLSAPLPLGFAFPMAGAASATWSHVVVDANGVLYLTNGGPAVGTPLFGAQNGVDDFRGDAGDSPRIAPLWADLWAGAGWSITANASVPGQFRVTWNNVEDVGSSSSMFSLSATLFATGEVEFAYTPTTSLYPYGYIGVAIGNGVGTGIESPDDLIGGGDSGTLGLLYGEYFNDPDEPEFSGKRIGITPNGTGGFTAIATCAPAAHTSYGAGCYTYQEAREALYQLFPNVAQSFAALPAGSSIQFTIAGPGSYLVSNGGGSFVPPSFGAVVLPLSDDDQEDVTPSIPFPHANGTSYAVLSVCSNGFVSMAPSGVNPNGTGGSVSRLLDAPAPSFRSQRDYNPAPAASGKVKVEEIPIGGAPTLVVTWDGVFLYNTTTPETFQFQLNLITGQVTIVWQLMTAVTPPTSRPLLVGLAQGNSFDPGPIVLATDLPQLTSPDVELLPLSLSAAPAPVIAPSTTVTFTIGNIPEFLPGSGVHLATLFFSVGTLPGVDLGFLGAPGCEAYIASLDLNLAVPLSATPVASTTLTFDNLSFAPGDVVYAQAIALFDPAFPLANGENAFGLTVSNGVRSRTDTF